MKKALKIVFNVIAWMVLIFALLITILVFSSDKNIAQYFDRPAVV